MHAETVLHKPRPAALIFVRHGQSERNALAHRKGADAHDESSRRVASMDDHNLPLTTLGEAQAVEAGRFLGRFGPFHKCYDSGATRARDTRFLALRSAGLSDLDIERLYVRSELLLREREFAFMSNMSPGEFPLHSLLVNWQKAYDANPFQTRLLNGESIADVTDRLRHFRRVVCANHAGETVVVFCHEVVMRAAIVLFLRQTIGEAMKTAKFRLPNCAIHVYRHARRIDATWQMEAYHSSSTKEGDISGYGRVQL